jgi:hypothetical protein
VCGTSPWVNGERGDGGQSSLMAEMSGGAVEFDWVAMNYNGACRVLTRSGFRARKRGNFVGGGLARWLGGGFLAPFLGSEAGRKGGPE